MLANFRRLVSGLLSAGICFSVSSANAESNVLFIFDASGSMKTAVGSDTRIGIAKKAMEGALKEMPSGVRLGLLMYGHRRTNDCTDIELVSPIGADDANTIVRTIQSVQPKGETPIATALRQAARSFQAFKGQNNSIVLVTDGIEECKGDPCAAANEIKAAGLDVKVHIVGFTLNDAQRKAIQCIPDVTGGKYFEAKDASGLNSALNQVRQQTTQAAASPPATPPSATPAAAPPNRLNLIAKSNGGEMIFGSGPDWGLLNDDALGYHYGFAAGNEGVYEFRNGQSATFDTFGVFIPSADSRNAKELEIFAGDEGPTGAFRSLGVVTIANGKLRDGWQEFKIPQTTAKYLKVRLLSNHGGNGYYLYELRLMGELVQASSDSSQASASPRSSAARSNLLPRAEVLLASGNDWKRLNDGGLGYLYGFGVGDEGIFAFEGGKAATFDTIGVYIPSEDSRHPREMEIFAGDEGPTGAFNSLGVITVLNGKMRDGWQDFKVPETTAKLVKVKILSNHGGNGLYLYELRLMGELK